MQLLYQAPLLEKCGYGSSKALTGAMFGSLISGISFQDKAIKESKFLSKTKTTKTHKGEVRRAELGLY